MSNSCFKIMTMTLLK